MDNAYILLLIIKRGINVGNFVNWYNWHFTGYDCAYNYTDYVKEFNAFYDDLPNRNSNHHDLGNLLLTEFEFKYFISYLRLRGDLHE